MKTDLGFKSKSYSGMPDPVPDQSEEQTYYPSFTASDNLELHDALEVGDEVTAKVKLRVTAKRNEVGGRQYGPEEDGCRVEFDVLSMDIPDKGGKKPATQEKPDFSKLGKADEPDEEG